MDIKSDKNLVMRFMGFVHFIMFCFTVTYILLFPKKHWFDTLYIYYFILVNIHWFFLNGECLIAYLYTKYHNKDYKAGDNPYANNDIIDLFSGYLPEHITQVLILILLILYLINVYFVLARNDFHIYIILLLIFSYVIYILSMRYNITFAKKYSIIHVIIYSFGLLYYTYMKIMI